SEGELRGEVVETLTGDHAHKTRHALSHANQQERMQRLESLLNESLKGFSLQSADLQQLEHPQNDLVMTLKLAVPQYGQVRGPLMLLRPRVLGEKSFDVEHQKPRLYPV